MPKSLNPGCNPGLFAFCLKLKATFMSRVRIRDPGLKPGLKPGFEKNMTKTMDSGVLFEIPPSVEFRKYIYSCTLSVKSQN